MTTGIVHDQNMEKQLDKQMGCMAGFLQLFDRHQMGKRLYTTKHLPPVTQIVNSSPETEKYVDSPATSKELEKPQATRPMTSPSPERYKQPQSTELLRSPASVTVPPVEMPPKSPLPLPLFGLNEGSRYSWKFCKETPRLSLDSRATFDAAKGSLYPKEIRTNASILSANRCNDSGDGADDKNHRSPSVIARLMGLEPLPNSSSTPEPKQAELRRSASESRVSRDADLRRSASESRVSRDIFQYRFTKHNSNNFQVKLQNQSQFAGNSITSKVISERNVDPMDYSSKNSRSELPKAATRGFKSPQQRKSFFDSADFFPETKQTVSIYVERERRLKMRGIDESSKDLETLKQILEAMQLKGLLHSKKPSSQIRSKNFVFDRNYSSSSDVQSPVVLMKPFNRRLGDKSPPSNFRSKSGVRRNESISSVSPRRDRATIDRNVHSPTRAKNASSPTRNESTTKNSNSNSLAPKKQLTIETQRRVNEYTENRRVSPINSPRISLKRNASDQTATNQSPRNRKPTVQIYAKEKITNTVVIEDESSSSISESTVSTPSLTDTERSKTEVEYKEGRRILERCDKLLHSIAEMNTADLQPSPVSVLDSSFYKDESSSSPSPVLKRSISFTDESVELEEDLILGSPGISSTRSNCEDENGDCDFVYVSEILRALSYASGKEGDDIFLRLEKQQYLEGKDTSSEVSRLQRKLIFETINEILGRKRQLPTWKAFAKYSTAKPSLQEIWSEFRKIRELETSEDLFEIVCGVLKKDLAGDATNGWVDCPVEMSEAVLDIERLIFKDLVGESIRDLTEFAGKSTFLAPRRKLVI